MAIANLQLNLADHTVYWSVLNCSAGKGEKITTWGSAGEAGADTGASLCADAVT